jgi:hypothetical protein
MTERDRWGLRGPIQSCRIQRTWYSRRCGADACEIDERGDASYAEFRTDGSLVRRWHHNPDGSEWTSTHEYDATGRLVSVRTSNTIGLIDFHLYDYDFAGRLVRVVDRSEDGRDRIAESYEYDATGRKKKTLYVDLAAQRSNTHYFWGVDGSDTGYSAPGTATVTTLHNTREQPTEVILHDVAGRLLSRVELVYDHEGHLVEEAQTRVAETLPPEMLAGMNPAQLEAVRRLFGAGGDRRLHRYDAQGRRIETCSTLFGPLGRDRKTMVYNDHGDQIGEVSEDEHREYSIDDTGLSERATKESVTRAEARFHYEYDARGNWIKKVVEARGAADQDFSLSSLEQRTLAYHD